MDASSDATFDNINPANRSDVLGVFPRSDHRDVDRAVEAARARFGVWGRMPATRRADILYGAAGILADRKADLAALLTREMGKVLPEASQEMDDCISLLRYIAGEGCRFGGAIASWEHPDALAMALPVPLGSRRSSAIGRFRWRVRCGSSRQPWRRATRSCSSRRRTRP